MATRPIVSLPSAAAGLSVVSSASAWTFGSAVTLTAASLTDLYICGLQFQNTDIPAAGVGQDILFEVTVGGTTKLQVPFNMKADTLVGYVMTASASIQSYYFPEAFLIPVGSAIAVKVADSIAAALTYNGVKLICLSPSFEDDAQAAIRVGLDSAQAEAAGWDAKVKPNIPLGSIVRTSDTVCTITLQAQADYDISAQEVITATVPAAALAGGVAVGATPTFTIDPTGGGGGPIIPVFMNQYRHRWN